MSEWIWLSFLASVILGIFVCVKNKTGLRCVRFNLSFPFLGYEKCNPSSCFCLVCLCFPGKIFPLLPVFCFSLIKLPRFILIKYTIFLLLMSIPYSRNKALDSWLPCVQTLPFGFHEFSNDDGWIVMGLTLLGSLAYTEDCFIFLWFSQQFNKLELLKFLFSD